VIDDILALVPELAGEVSVSVLEGGLTNANFRVVSAAGVFVVRRWSDESALLAIDREAEHECSVAAAVAGVGGAVVAFLPERRAIVLGWIEGRTLSATALRDGEVSLARVASACRRLHGARPVRAQFDMFEVQARYLALVRARGFRLPDGYLAYAGRVREIQAALGARPEARVLCHNDLLAENLLDTAEGVRIIDYEYAGMNEPSFELGNLWSESDLGLPALSALVGAYWDRHGAVVAGKVARARLWGLMSKYGWTLWASIQDGVSTIEFDFWAWGMEKYVRAVAEFEDPGLEALLAAAREG
jgi:thiamine kinase-like enzyme